MSMLINPYLFAFAPPPAGTVVSLLNMGGADGSAVFTDSTGLRTWTAFGDAQIDTSMGYNAALFDGAGDYISTPHSADLVLGNQEFCIEGFFRLPDVSTTQCLIEKRGTGFNPGDWAVFVNAGQIIIYSADVDSGSNVILNSSTLSTNTQYHWAWTRGSTGTMALYLQGTLESTKDTLATIISSSVPLAIGRDAVSGGRFWLNGLVRASRITTGSPVYMSNFTPPTPPFSYP